MLLLIAKRNVMSCDYFLDGVLLGGWLAGVRFGINPLVRMAGKESKDRTDDLYDPSIWPPDSVTNLPTTRLKKKFSSEPVFEKEIESFDNLHWKLPTLTGY